MTDATAKQNFAHSIDLNYAPEFKESDRETQAVTAQFNLPKLRRLLKQYGQFPDKYRTLTWKYLLKLPLNREAFQNLLNRGVHPAYKDLHKRFPVASYRIYNKLVRILSALGHWSPVFCDLSFMPAIVFAFLKVIPNDDLFVFELIMSLVVQWMQVWFEQHPAEPLSVCMAVEQILGSEDPRLVQHMRDLGFQTQHYGWPLLSSFFTEALSKDDWLKLIDHLFMKSEEPELFLYFLSGYLICHKSQLMQIGCVEDLSVFLCQQSTVPFKKMMTTAENLHLKLKTAVFPGNCGQNLPVCGPGSIYQSFTRYPEHFVEFQNRVREKIVNQEEEIQRKAEILIDLKSKSKEIAEQEERMRLQQDAMARAEFDRKIKLRTEMEQLLQERIRLDELQRKARLEHVQAIESAIKTSLTQQERLREEEHRQIQEEVNAIQRQQKYEFESRMQDEMIANLEFKANQKLLEQLQKQQQEEHSRINREKLDSLNQELLQRQQESMKRWEEQRAQIRTQNQMLTHQLKVQQEELNSDREQRFISEKFKEVKQEQDQMDQQLLNEQYAREQQRFSEVQKYNQMKKERELLSQQLANEQFEKEQQERDQKKWKAAELIRHKEEAAKQLIQERERQEKEKQAKQYLDQQARQVYEEQAELERLKQQANLDRQRVQQVAEERKNEVEKARRMRAEEIAEDQRIADERRRIQEEKEQIMRARAELNQKEKTEIERRDFMKMIRTTAENVREIVKDGQQQIANEREARLSREVGTQPHSWVAAPQEGNIPYLSPQQQQVNVQDVMSERERMVREQNEALREQLSLQYSQHMQRMEKENVGRTSNSETSHQTTMTEDYQNNQGFTLRQKHAQLMTPSSTSESHYSDESSEVESYHQSKIKQMTYVGMQQAPSGHAFQPVPLHLQTHLLPFKHQQLGAMPGSKSSVGEDISSSFVSSATESQLNFNGMQRPQHQAAYGDYLSDSMLTSSYEGGSQSIDNQIQM